MQPSLSLSVITLACVLVSTLPGVATGGAAEPSGRLLTPPVFWSIDALIRDQRDRQQNQLNLYHQCRGVAWLHSQSPFWSICPSNEQSAIARRASFLIGVGEVIKAHADDVRRSRRSQDDKRAALQEVIDHYVVVLSFIDQEAAMAGEAAYQAAVAAERSEAEQVTAGAAADDDVRKELNTIGNQARAFRAHALWDQAEVNPIPDYGEALDYCESLGDDEISDSLLDEWRGILLAPERDIVKVKGKGAFTVSVNRPDYEGRWASYLKRAEWFLEKRLMPTRRKDLRELTSLQRNWFAARRT